MRTLTLTLLLVGLVALGPSAAADPGCEEDELCVCIEDAPAWLAACMRVQDEIIHPPPCTCDPITGGRP